VVEAALGVLAASLVLFLLADLWLGLRDGVAWRAATALVAKGDEARQIDTIRYQIGVLLRPRDGAAGIGADSSGRMIEAALLYARIPALEEAEATSRLRSSVLPEESSCSRPHITQTQVKSTFARQPPLAARQKSQE